MLEKILQNKLTNHINKYPPSFFSNTKATFYELKIINHPRKSVTQATFRPQQIPMLLEHEKTHYHHKFSDLDPRIKMCDGMYTPQATNYVAICYYTPNKKQIIYFIRVKLFNKLLLKIKKVKEKDILLLKKVNTIIV